MGSEQRVVGVATQGHSSAGGHWCTQTHPHTHTLSLSHTHKHTLSLSHTKYVVNLLQICIRQKNNDVFMVIFAPFMSLSPPLTYSLLLSLVCISFLCFRFFSCSLSLPVTFSVSILSHFPFPFRCNSYFFHVHRMHYPNRNI